MGLDEFAVLGDAIQHYGPEAQQIKAVEEMSELTKELCKRLAGADNVLQIAEEIADVRIMLDQLEMMLCCTGRVKTFRSAKLRRLEERVREARGLDPSTPLRSAQDDSSGGDPSSMGRS